MKLIKKVQMNVLLNQIQDFNSQFKVFCLFLLQVNHGRP